MSVLEQPLRLPCGVDIPNRLGKSAMTEGLADPYDKPTTAHDTLYRRWSEGGTGLLITGNVMVDPRYLERAGNVVLEKGADLEPFKRWASAGTAAGNQLWMQINHPGRQCPRMVNSRPLSPSDVQLQFMGNFGRPRAMDEADILEVIERFANTAELAKQAGFTGVQIHSAHGYLLSQFLSPKINQRSDQWGGSLENRARLLRRVVAAVRDKVGADFPLSVKLNSSDFQQGGFSLEDCVVVAGWLADDGIDLLEISGGTYEQLSLMGVEPTEVRESTRKREAYFIEYARAIKDAASIPVMVTGGFRQREVMEAAIANGETDMIGLARPLCTQANAAQLLFHLGSQQLDDFSSQLVLGKGIWGHNSSIGLIKAINTLGQVGFYYRQIILLAQGRETDPNLGVFFACLRHLVNDMRLILRRKGPT